MTTAYVGRHRRGELVVTRRPEDTELTPDRSLDLVNHSPSGFEVGFRGSGPAQLACALLLDYYYDEQVAEWLGITEDTVNTHLSNIAQKRQNAQQMLNLFGPSN